MTMDQLLCPTTKTWDREKVRMLLPSYEKEIFLLRPSKLGARDRYVWLPNKWRLLGKDRLSRSCALSHQGSQLADPPLDFNWYKEIWTKLCPPKMKYFLWKAMKNALPVGEKPEDALY